MQILLTGASGFVGRGLVPPLLARRHKITAAMRNLNAEFDLHIDQVQISGLSADQKWQPLLAGKDLVIHLAARVHVMSDNSADPLVEYRRVNVDGTLHLARQAADAGVKRFIFISSIKVNGESTTGGMAYTADGPTAPTDPYGISKMEAERGLRALADETGMEVVIIRQARMLFQFRRCASEGAIAVWQGCNQFDMSIHWQSLEQRVYQRG